jgi:hypothetical protein
MAFGSIIHNFARHEYLMQCIMSSIVDTPLTPVSILTVELGYSARRNALLSLMRTKPLPKRQLVKIEGFLARLHKRNALRNAIAHHLWKEGSRPCSVRSMGLSVRRGEAIVLGNDEEYTVDKLIKIANELSRLYDQFFAYLDGEGLSHSMSKKMDFTQAEASLSPGKPSAK